MNLTAKSSLALVLSATMMLNWNTAAAENIQPVTDSPNVPPYILAEGAAPTTESTPSTSETSDAEASANADEASEAPDARLPLKELRLFAEIFNNIRTSYVETVDDKTLLQNAIRGMLSGLDPHSAYLDSKVFEELQINTSGEFGGLGIEVQMDNGFVRVVTPIDETPAFRAGLKSGDLIMKLDDKPVKGMSLDDAIKHMRGEPGSDIILQCFAKAKNSLLNSQ